MTEITVTLVQFTPRKAQEYLEKYNKGNRRFDKYHALNLAYEMKNGTWVQTGDTRVKITRDMIMIDGQHTLNAVILSQKTTWLYVAENVEKKAFAYIDIGKKRSTADILSIEHFKYPTILAPMIRNILSYNQRKGIGRNRSADEYRASISNAAVLDFSDQNKLEVEEIAGYCNSIKKHIPYLPVSGLAFLYWTFHRKSKTLVDDFFHAWASGEFLSGDKVGKEHPIYHLRHKLITDVNRQYKYRDRVSIAIFAWNLCREGTTKISNIQLKTDYEFPRAK